MPYSARDVARRAAVELSRSADPRLSAGAGKVEQLLMAPPKTPDRFDAATAIAIAGLIIKIAELAYKIWSDRQVKSAAAANIEAALTAEAKAVAVGVDPKIVAETTKVISDIVQSG
jgi:hypothetical protein